MVAFKIFLMNTMILFSASGDGGGDRINEFLEAIRTLLDGIFERLNTTFSQLILDFLQTQIMFLFNWLTSMVLTFSGDIFENQFVKDWFSVISLLAKLCFVVGLTLYIANSCIKMSAGRKALIGNEIKTYAVYLVFGWFGVDGALLIFKEVNAFLASNLISKSVTSLEAEILIEIGIWNGIVMVQIAAFIVMIICFVSFFISVIKRIGYIFALVSVIPLYMLSFSKGYSSGFFSWLRMFASCCITFFLQYTMFYLAVTLLVSNAFILALLLFVSVPVVPTVLAQFGSGTTTMGDIMNDVSSTAKQGAQMAAMAL